MKTQLTFQNTTLQTITRNNQTYITATDLAIALEYADTSSVLRIYARNEDEFTPEMSLSVKMTANGINNSQRQIDVRLFSLRGAHLIAMFARTPVAKAFRKWVLDVLEREISQKTEQISPLAEEEETLRIIVKLFHSLNTAHDLCGQLRTKAPYLVQDIDKTIGGHFMYNLNHPTRNALDEARRFIHEKSERIMFIKGMLSLLEQPQPKRIADF